MSDRRTPTTITAELIAPLQALLDEHPIYARVQSREDLCRFMQHHVYSVWDFMSLVKTLQAQVAGTSVPWLPRGDGNVRRFINELVLEEESDALPGDRGFASHFELYLEAMREVGADTRDAEWFIETVAVDGVHAALALPGVPAPSRRFTTTTFAFIDSGRPHRVAAALALGREHIIPGMFRAILARIGVQPDEAPVFHYYLNRHIGLDEDFHAPLSLRLLNALCEGNTDTVTDALEAADTAIAARLALWDGVLAALNGA